MSTTRGRVCETLALSPRSCFGCTLKRRVYGAAKVGFIRVRERVSGDGFYLSRADMKGWVICLADTTFTMLPGKVNISSDLISECSVMLHLIA